MLVVLGSRLRPGGAPGPAMMRRVRLAAALLRSERADAVLASGGPAGAQPTEAEVMRAMLIAQGVPEALILVEPRSRNTFENAWFSAGILAGRGARPVIVVTDRYHLPRALLAFRIAGLRATGAGTAWEGRGRPGRRLLAVLREIVAVPALLLRAAFWWIGRP